MATVYKDHLQTVMFLVWLLFLPQDASRRDNAVVALSFQKRPKLLGLASCLDFHQLFDGAVRTSEEKGI